MKILSVIIPCYNAQDYMEHAIETLLTGGERLEILLVDDALARLLLFMLIFVSIVS